jgi:hypothetical protein
MGYTRVIPIPHAEVHGVAVSGSPFESAPGNFKVVPVYPLAPCILKDYAVNLQIVCWGAAGDKQGIRCNADNAAHCFCLNRIIWPGSAAGNGMDVIAGIAIGSVFDDEGIAS